MKLTRKFFIPAILLAGAFCFVFTVFIQPHQTEKSIHSQYKSRFGEAYETQFYGNRNGHILELIETSSGKQFLVEHTRWNFRVDASIVSVSEFEPKK